MRIAMKEYLSKLKETLNNKCIDMAEPLCKALLETWAKGGAVFICGNGGSAGNAIHLANDLIYGAGKANGRGLRVEALSANSAVITCLANDIGYENIYSEQIKVKGVAGDMLIALSGSGNSPNIINAILQANTIGMKTYAILGFSGGRCKELAKHPIHFPVDDMQIAEDLQLIVGHMCMQWLSTQSVGK